MEVPFRESTSSREAPEIAAADNIEPSPGAGTTPLDLDLAPRPGGTTSTTHTFTVAQSHPTTATPSFTSIHTPNLTSDPNAEFYVCCWLCSTSS